MAAATHTPTYPSGATAQTGLRGSAVPRVDTSDRVSVAPPPSSDRPQFPLTPAPTPVEESSKSSSPEFEGAARTSSTSGAATDSDADGGVLPLRRIASSTAVAHSPKVVLPVPRPDGDHRQRSTFREHRKNALSVGALPYPPVPGLGPPSSASQPAGRDRNRSRNLTIAPGSSSLSPAANGVDHRQPQTARLAKTSWRHPRPPSLTNLGWDVPSADLDSLTARPSMLQSPCFFHRRFDDAVNLDRVVEEISGDEGMSHSRLMQTATGVREVSKQLRRRPIKRAVRTVMIVTKARDHDLVTMTRELAEWLMSTPRYGSGVGVHVYVDAKLRHSKRFDAAGLVQKNARFEELLDYWTPHLCWSSPDRFDLVLTLGGDGTVLFTSWLFQRIVPPVLSFSLGSLGFLTNFQFDDYREHLDRVMGDAGMKVNLRMRFTCTVYRCKNRPSDGRRRRRSRRRRGAEGADAVDPPELEQGEQFEVLNEVVIDRGPSPYVSNLELYGDDELLTVVQADGCIFSTPTGSTAYSLSAGGSLVHPDIPAILLTPICPHSLSFRPMLLNDSMLLRVCVPRQSRATAYCSFDGKGRIELKQGDHVTIAASQFPFPTVLSQSSEWFDSIGRTLRWNSRSSVQKGWNAKSDKSGDAGVGEQKSGERVNGQGPDDAAGTDMEGEDKSREKGHHGNDTDDNDDDDDDDDDYYNEDGNEDGDEDGDSDPDEAWDIDTDTTDGGTYVQSST